MMLFSSFFCANAQEPIPGVIFTVEHGKGRIFHIMIGHCGDSLIRFPSDHTIVPIDSCSSWGTPSASWANNIIPFIIVFSETVLQLFRPPELFQFIGDIIPIV